MCLQDTQTERTRAPRISNTTYACAPLIDGLGHATRSATVAVSRFRTQSFQQNRSFIFQGRVVLQPLVSLIGRLVACSARISVDRHTDRTTTVTLAAHARRGLIMKSHSKTRPSFSFSPSKTSSGKSALSSSKGPLPLTLPLFYLYGLTISLTLVHLNSLPNPSRQKISNTIPEVNNFMYKLF